MWHEDGSLYTEPLHRAGDGRTVIAAGCSNTSSRTLFIRERQQPVGCPAQLEGPGRLPVLLFVPDLGASVLAGRNGIAEGRVHDMVCDAFGRSPNT